jgi:indole-3-glycerol phosphate synthase
MSNTILDTIANYTRERIEEKKKKIPLQMIKLEASKIISDRFSFENALRKPELSFICECKKASPSKGIIADNFPYLKIAKEYEKAGADCISVLTEPKWFLGSDEYLTEIAKTVAVPLLRKDFTVDEYMIYEAKIMGASCVLLICSILSLPELKYYKDICDELGLSALVECHNEAEIETAQKINARIIGVNNRNLKDFSVDTNNSKRLRDLVPKDILFVSESGVSSPKDIKNIKDMGADAALVGEILMRSTDKKATLDWLRGKNDKN